MVQQTLYSIEFFDNERKFMPYCYFELSVNGNLVTGLPPRADSQGKVWINKQWVESMASAPKELVVSFWNTEFPKTQHSETEKFIWPEGKTSIKAFLPDVYTINTRPLANENNEEQAYQRAYYLVRKGDTWERLEAELGVNTVEALILHNRMSYSDQLVEGAKLYYPLGFRTRNEMGSNTAKKKTTEKEEEPKQSEAKQEKTIEQRSQANGKPEEVAKPKEDGCFCYRDFTVEEFKKIVEELRKSENKTSTSLWNPRFKGGATPNDKSYETTVNELNRVMNKYEINTCIRKIHYLAQVYHETDRFNSTQEYDSPYTPGYDPYRGRGFIHLTHLSNYTAFENAMGNNKIHLTPSIVATDVQYAFESGAWYWCKHSAWGNLNNAADRDDLYYVNIGVNGGFIGFQERITYAKRLINIFNVKECKNLSLNKALGIYRFSDSRIKDTKFGKKHEKEFEVFDE
ncbi:glycoside hydrolase family 19 protein [Aggregatibacter actinomycetemcomitans]|uniref:glycoside hydrolase family 19 protein n=1 Tax=Aggregatibacter actinomycetemcomitans TaxID=714 RepID=UPI001F11FACB|nr:glycoside hydrolase family 19 protein [Aggregatibacter actinomycetemcomitans]